MARGLSHLKPLRFGKWCHSDPWIRRWFPRPGLSRSGGKLQPAIRSGSSSLPFSQLSCTSWTGPPTGSCPSTARRSCHKACHGGLASHRSQAESTFDSTRSTTKSLKSGHGMESKLRCLSLVVSWHLDSRPGDSKFFSTESLDMSRYI